MSALLLLFGSDGSGLTSDFLLLLLSKFNIVVLGVELLEGGGIDLNNCVFDEGLGSDELVVGGIVNDIQDSGLGGEGLGSPCEVTNVNSESAELVVATAASDSADLLGTELGLRWLSGHLELSLLLMAWHATSSCSSLVARVS